MRRRSFAVVALAAIACFDGSGPSSQARISLSPLLDSLFVGDTQAPRLTVTYVTAEGDTQAAGRLTWRSDDPAVATVDTAGRVVAMSRGEAIISATANGVTGRALVIVTRTLDITLLLDTIYLMIGDTITAPVQVRRKAGGAPEPVFEAPTQAVFEIDPAGLITATANGGYFHFVAHADTVADTGWVQVVAPIDTTVARSRAHFSMFGTVIRRSGGPVRALNYRLNDESQGFRLNLSIQASGVTVENVIVTLLDSVVAPGAFFVDSLSPGEAFGAGGADPVCRPVRPWGIWASIAFNPPINAVSRRGGSLAVTQIDTVLEGLVISGRFAFDAQRLDFYDDPGGLLPIRGTFVAPLVTSLDNRCQ